MLLEVIQPTGYSLAINSLRPGEHVSYLEIKHNGQIYVMTINFYTCTFIEMCMCSWISHIDDLMQERRNYSAKALELRLSYTNPSISEIFTSRM